MNAEQTYPHAPATPSHWTRARLARGGLATRPVGTVFNIDGGRRRPPDERMQAMSLSDADREILEDNWGTARAEVARQLPNVRAANLGNTVKPEHIAMLSGQDQDRVDEVLGEVAKQLKKDEKDRKDGKSDKPGEQIAVDNAQDARRAAAKVDEERAKESQAADDKNVERIVSARTAGLRK